METGEEPDVFAGVGEAVKRGVAEEVKVPVRDGVGVRVKVAVNVRVVVAVGVPMEKEGLKVAVGLLVRVDVDEDV